MLLFFRLLLPAETIPRTRPLTNTFYRRFDCFVLLLAGVASDFALRRATFILPWYIFQYAAAAFWAIALYALLGLLFPRLTPRQLALFSSAVAAVVEFSRLVHTPAFDAFRITLPGRFLLGRFFDPLDLAICWLAIVAIALFDRFVLQPRYP